MKRSLLSTLLLFPALAALAGPAEPFNGKDLTNWEVRGKADSKWTVGEPSMSKTNPATLDVKAGGNALVNVVAGHGQSHDLVSKETYGDIKLEVEVMVPKGSNSGIYLMGNYEVQVFDSFGVAKMRDMDMGAIYSASPPKVNASKAPGEWQKYVIEFRAPKFDDKGQKTANAKFVKVELNGTVIHENVEMKGVTGGALSNKEIATGPLMFQGDHGAVAYRNIKVTPLK
ncbi:MAG TPA: DUF1080 domain-containing protein [Verrucomicrobiales bacterium]|nr:DUF1080 domain-containing protein [Verrucomicrobiales bacterium]